MIKSGIIEKIIAESNPERGRFMKSYLKTGNRTLGISMPALRRIVDSCPDMPTSAVLLMIESELHEVRMAGLLLLCRKFDAARSEEDRRLIFDCYMEHLSVINCWDLVDATCTRIVGKYLLDKERSILYELAGSGDLWTQRIAVVSTLAFVRLRDLPDALAISDMLLSSPYRLVHTAVGWVLREVGKTDKPALTTFIEEHYADMPRVTLRYAIERFSPSEKKYYMGLPYSDNKINNF